MKIHSALVRSQALLLGLFVSTVSSAGGLTSEQIDALATRAMAEFDVPGMAIGIVKDGETVYAAGHGIREVGKNDAIDTDTMFRIASVSKAFTSAALAVLVDRGEVAWDGAVVDYLPEFRMNEPQVTAQISLVDLLAHRSGLAPHAGDLLLWPVPNDFTTADVIHALRYFPLERGFRKGYTYENLLYLVAGEIVGRVSGRAWGEFVDQNIMRPLGLERCYAGQVPLPQMRNLAAPHGVVDGELRVIERNRTPAEPDKFAPAGGVVCSVNDMLHWLQTQLSGGTSPAGVELFSADQREQMWSPHNDLRVSASARALHKTKSYAYGLGWRLRDVHGFREVSHTGSLDGVRAQALMIPELNLGIVVLANGSNSAARNAVMYTIEYSYLPVEPPDWMDYYLSLAATARAAAEQTDQGAGEAIATPGPLPSRPLASYTGNYLDPWFGQVRIALNEAGLTFESARSPQLSGLMSHHSGDEFIVQWDNRLLGMDAYVRFKAGPDGRARSMSMERKLENGQYDPDHFQYLDFRRVE